MLESVTTSLPTWINTGIRIVIALLILLVSFKIINAIARRIEKKLLAVEKLDKTLTKTLAYIAKIALKVIIVISLVGYLGIDTSGLAAFVAALGVSVGLAVNGALSNLAGGALLLVTRPFKIGDYISAQGYEGTVEEIRIVNTKIVTVDNKVVNLPNGALSSGSIVNYSEKVLRRVDHVFSVGGNDPEKVKEVILGVCAECDKVLQDPAPFARVSDYGAGNGVKVTLRAWTESANYWDVYFDLLEKVNAAFDANGITIPFNRLDVHVKN
jgi:small conductance mechanosensitive channel